MRLGQTFTDSNLPRTVGELSEKYGLAKSTVAYRLKNNIPLLEPKPIGNSQRMKANWSKRKQEMTDFIAEMDKRKKAINA